LRYLVSEAYDSQGRTIVEQEVSEEVRREQIEIEDGDAARR
jgi:hypothetical protein